MFIVNCLICEKHKRKNNFLFQDDVVFAAHYPLEEKKIYLGHLLIEPLRHVTSLADLSIDESKSLGATISCFSKKLKVHLNAEHVYLFVIGDKVPHLHFHLIPRYPNTPKDYWGFKITEYPDALTHDETRIHKVCNQLKSLPSNEY